jgi:hypothetical protein
MPAAPILGANGLVSIAPALAGRNLMGYKQSGRAQSLPHTRGSAGSGLACPPVTVLICQCCDELQTLFEWPLPAFPFRLATGFF